MHANALGGIGELRGIRKVGMQKQGVADLEDNLVLRRTKDYLRLSFFVLNGNYEVIHLSKGIFVRSTKHSTGALSGNDLAIFFHSDDLSDKDFRLLPHTA